MPRAGAGPDREVGTWPGDAALLPLRGLPGVVSLLPKRVCSRGASTAVAAPSAAVAVAVIGRSGARLSRRIIGRSRGAIPREPRHTLSAAAYPVSRGNEFSHVTADVVVVDVDVVVVVVVIN